MYVCICKAVTEKQIREAIDTGACTRKAISACLEAGTGCGKCNPEISKLLRRGRPESLELAAMAAYPRAMGGVAREAHA